MPLLASFAAGNANARSEKDGDEYLYMILPLADINLKDWMTFESENVRTKEDRQNYIYDLMLSITSGIAFIHKEDNKKMVGFHHDVKPSNIVCFREPNKETWKICDFGGANLKNAKDETGSSYHIGTRKYAPPEYFDAGGEKRGRAFDIFSLGCVFLELATLWRYGWDSGGLHALDEHFQAANNEASSSSNEVIYCKNMAKVNEWISDLEKDDSKKFGEVLKMIREMLQEERSQRIFAWEVEIDLFILMEPPKPWEEIVLRFEGIVQFSRKAVNAIGTTHNPLVRARNKDRPKPFLNLLINRKWSDNIPGSTKESRRLSFDLKEWFSNLETPEDRKKMYGRQEESQWIETQFAEAPSIGLYGLGGVGWVFCISFT